MLSRSPPAWPVVLFAILGGCKLPPPPAGDLAPESSQAGRLGRELDHLRSEMGALRSERDALAARVAELRRREEALAAELRRLQFANAQQAEQIKTLATVPAERDRYRAKAERLTLEVARLTRRLQQLQRQLEAPPAASAPASRPAGAR